MVLFYSLTRIWDVLGWCHWSFAMNWPVKMCLKFNGTRQQPDKVEKYRFDSLSTFSKKVSELKTRAKWLQRLLPTLSLALLITEVNCRVDRISIMMVARIQFELIRLFNFAESERLLVSLFLSRHHDEFTRNCSIVN